MHVTGNIYVPLVPFPVLKVTQETPETYLS
jgi:hypothetical protein